MKVRLASPEEEQEALAHRELREALLEQEMERSRREGGNKSGGFVRVHSEEFQLQSTSRGGPTCEAEQVVLLVEVVDTGLGISQGVAANIFSAFVQVGGYKVESWTQACTHTHTCKHTYILTFQYICKYACIHTFIRYIHIHEMQ